MADKMIGELPAASFVDDESLFVMEQQAEALSVSGRIFKYYAREGVQDYVDEAKQAAESATKSAGEAAQSAADAAQSAQDAAKSAEQARQSFVESALSAKDAQNSANLAAQSEQASQDSATLSESWAVGGTGTRTGEDANNSKYWAGVAQAEADRATVPVIAGVYNVILTDRVTGGRYALLAESGRLTLLGVSDTLDATDLTLIDNATGISYAVVVDSGRLAIEEV